MLNNRLFLQQWHRTILWAFPMGDAPSEIYRRTKISARPEEDQK
jgi:hypothetical protein